MATTDFLTFVNEAKALNEKENFKKETLKKKKEAFKHLTSSVSVETLDFILKETKMTAVELHESKLFEFVIGGLDSSKLGGMFSGALDIGAKTVLTSMIQPVLDKLGVNKSTFVWYFLSYGLSSAITDLGKDILTAEQPKFCQAFTNGAVKGIYAYFAAMGYDRIAQMLGFKSNSALATNIMINMGDFISKDVVSKWVYSIVCSGGKSGKSLYDVVKSTVSLENISGMF